MIIANFVVIAGHHGVLEPLAVAAKTAMIPNRSLHRSCDQHLYTSRRLIENFFAKFE
jgi:hypothetical protein